MTCLLSCHDVLALSERSKVRIVEVAQVDGYADGHIPGAIHLPYALLTASRGQATGVLPKPDQLQQLMAHLGLSPDTHIIAYDREGGGRAARLLWTLDVLGHPQTQVMDGGWQRWQALGLPESTAPQQAPSLPTPSLPRLNLDLQVEQQQLLNLLQDPQVVIWDTRSGAEYTGEKKLAARAGHIPGAVHYEWTRAHDPDAPYQLRPLAEIQAELATLGISAEKTIISYCQAHHRSAFAYMLMKALGFSHAKAYSGAWSEWGNHPELPIEV